MSVHNEENKCYVDSGCSKDMTWDKCKFMSLREKDRRNNITFGNNVAMRIKGKRIVSLDEKNKARNVLYVEGLKNNFISVS